MWPAIKTPSESRHLLLLFFLSSCAIALFYGAGLMWGIEIDRDAAPVARRLLDAGFVVGTAQQRVIRILPPYVVPKTALSSFLTALERILEEGTH